MLGKCTGLTHAFRLEPAQDLFKGLVAAGIHLDALPGGFFHNPVRKVFYGVQEACTGIIRLFFVLWCSEYTIDTFGHVWPEYRSPAPVIRTVFGIDFFVIKVFRPHMAVLCDIQREVFIRPFMLADQPVVLITDTNLSRCRFKDCRFAAKGVHYRIVVAIILDVVIIRNLVDRFIVTYRKCSAWQWFHARFVVLLESIFPRKRLVLKPPGVENRYCFCDGSIQFFQ